jgi:hypothetical protein
MLCVCVPFQVLDQLPDFDETWYERYRIEGQPNFAQFRFLRSVITTRLTFESGAKIAPLSVGF